MEKSVTLLALGAVVSVAFGLGTTVTAQSQRPNARVSDAAIATVDRGNTLWYDDSMPEIVQTRVEGDVAALSTFRPSYPFWRHIFTVPDGAIVFGSAVDGRLLATFPARGDWAHDAEWADAWASAAMGDAELPDDVSERRTEVARRLESAIGPVVHNPSRGLFLLPNVSRFGPFLAEWSVIYERFAVPHEIGLAQAIVESGLSGTVRSEARAMGFCQWLRGSWKRLQRLSPRPIEVNNQTTQAAYCAAYLTVLATKHGSFIPALSEHHTGGANVGRTLINGQRLGGTGVREQYFLGSQFARDVRVLSPGTFSDVYGTYGPRSALYAEMVFGNAANVAQLLSTVPQTKIFAMRAARALTAKDITRKTGLSLDELRRFNPALAKRVPKGGTLYLPEYVSAFGRNVSFWHRPPSRAYVSVLQSFVDLTPSAEEWNSAEFSNVLQDFRRRFAATQTEEGVVMATVLAYVNQDRGSSGEANILAQFRNDQRILRLFEQAEAMREQVRAAPAGDELADPTVEDATPAFGPASR